MKENVKNFVILTDSRQQSEQHILREFDKLGIVHIRTALPSADYMALRFDDQKGMYFDSTVLIDTKKDLLEVAHNLCNTSEHERIKREIFKAKELGCKKFYFLIAESKIKSLDDIKRWSSKHTKIKGETLFKIMCTMSKKYDIIFAITSKKNVGKKIVELLKESGIKNDKII